MPLTRSPDNSKDNAIRRVVKYGSLFICGMCTTRHESEALAEACLEKCVKNYMQQQPVTDKSAKTGTAYRCSYCKRVYEKLLHAKECAKSCKQDIQKKLDTESRMKSSQSRDEKLRNLAAFAGDTHNIAALKNVPLVARQAEAPAPSRPPSPPIKTPIAPVAKANKQVDSVPTPNKKPMGAPQAAPPLADEGTKFTRDNHSYRCQKCKESYKKYQEAVACFDRHRAEAQAELAIKKDSDSKFYRDGAKYACKKCNKKYFSRPEVVTCFDGHAAEEEVWVTGAPKPNEPAEETRESKQKANLEAIRSKRSVNKSEAEKFFRDGAKYVCRECNKKHFTKSETIQCFDSHSDASADEGSGPTLTSDDLAAIQIDIDLKKVKIGNNRDGEDKFYRDGAKYVCKKCNSKHFTRGEVVECFDKH